MTRHTILQCATLTMMLSMPAFGDDHWPQWRGPLGTGVAAEGDYPETFSAEEGLMWKVALPGRGSSTPAVWGEKVLVTCSIDGQDGLVCYDLKGEEKWRRQFGDERAGKHRNGTGSNPSPATDGEHVVVYFKSGNLACLDLDGNPKWKINLQDLHGEDTLWWDLGTSPILAGDKVIVAVLQAGDSYLAAFQLADGSLAWKQPRTYERPEESDQAYTTPQIVEIDGRDVLVTWGADHLTGHDPATGKLLWECGGFNPENQGYWRVIASAAISDGMAIVPYGRGEYLAGVRLGGQGDVTKSNRVWEKRGKGIGADVPTPVVVGKRAYVLSDSGRILCLDVQTGDEIWTANLPRNRNRFFASPVMAGDKLYLAREDGMVFVGRVNEKGFELLGENAMGEQLIATPVPVDDTVILRGAEHLFRVGQSPDKAVAGG
jgi:outer membrane protein assembly factor BamB